MNKHNIVYNAGNSDNGKILVIKNVLYCEK